MLQFKDGTFTRLYSIAEKLQLLVEKSTRARLPNMPRHAAAQRTADGLLCRTFAAESHARTQTQNKNHGCSSHLDSRLVVLEVLGVHGCGIKGARSANYFTRMQMVGHEKKKDSQVVGDCEVAIAEGERRMMREGGFRI